MVPLRRGEAPRILRERAAEWTQAYVAQCVQKPQRPRSRTYNHPEVREELRRMSHGKCFYCERKLAEADEQVDHYVEVEARRDLAFEWANLYLACATCNNTKAADSRIPNADCVDPCDASRRPTDHLTFDDERIAPRDDRGRKTMQKYRLDRDELDLIRGRFLREFMKRVIAVKNAMIADGRKTFSDREREILRLYRDPAMPFSLMMDGFLTALGL